VSATAVFGDWRAPTTIPRQCLLLIGPLLLCPWQPLAEVRLTGDRCSEAECVVQCGSMFKILAGCKKSDLIHSDFFTEFWINSTDFCVSSANI
jgi:hypothetical protein